ncbi:MAG: hypothetical protein ACREVZ_17095, partial [Burkholderiales bacterium]
MRIAVALLSGKQSFFDQGRSGMAGKCGYYLTEVGFSRCPLLKSATTGSIGTWIFNTFYRCRVTNDNLPIPER